MSGSAATILPVPSHAITPAPPPPTNISRTWTVATAGISGSKLFIQNIQVHPSASGRSIGHVLQEIQREHVSTFSRLFEATILLQERIVATIPKHKLADALSQIDLERGPSVLQYNVSHLIKKPNEQLTRAKNHPDKASPHHDFGTGFPRLASLGTDAELVVVARRLNRHAAEVVIAVEASLAFVASVSLGLLQRDLKLAVAILLPAAILGIILKVMIYRSKS